ncbi:MAG: autotransporter outer membrane beta-barrel domain-containing protein [Alphaproteobacteria bacterium]|nr:autotransporter outer membrane beta-barrel domain-containing protein [Alphaproteobacteria bacterium]MCW5739996.1 autotransporter outer membrane beta-barrel domain-containing protein [Alphaproteobacteria bacterium]
MSTQAIRLRAGLAVLGFRLSQRSLPVIAGTFLSIAAFASAGAQTLSFGPTGAGGTGAWDNTTVNWFDGAMAVPWASGGTAVFGGTAGTVTVNGTVSAGGLVFNTSGYTITGGALALSGTTASITTNTGVSATISSPLSGSAALVKTGGGTLTIGNVVSTYTGGTTVSQGTLVFGGNQALGSGTVILGDANTGASSVSLLANFPNFFIGNIPNNIVVNSSGAGTVSIGTTVFNPGSNGTIFGGTITLNGDVTFVGGSADRTSFNGPITGTGNITISGGRRITIDSSANDFVGSVTINPGNLLQVNAVSVLPGTTTLNMLGNARFRFANTGHQTIDALNGSSSAFIDRVTGGQTILTVGAAGGSGVYEGVIGSGISFTKVGAGTQVMSGLNAYNGPTTISGGVLSTPNLANGGAQSGIGLSSNAASNLVLNGGVLQYTGIGASTDRQLTLTTNGGGLAASGSGALSFTSAASIALSGAGARTLLLTGDNTSANTLSPVLGDSGGSSSLTKTGGGTWVLTGVHSYTGSTQISAGTLALSGSGAVATSTRVIADATFDISAVTDPSSSIRSLAGNGSVSVGTRTLVITAANDTFAGGISGSGGLTLAAGTQTLSGDNTYSGGTTISGGTLRLGDGGTSGMIVGDVVNDGVLAFNRADALVFGGLVTGTGGLSQIGTGRTTINLDLSGLTGLSQVLAGTLEVNGTLGGTMEVLGGRLQGTGQVGPTTNFAAGTIAPGNSIGTLTINGDYVGAGGTLEIEAVLGGDASPSDRLVVTGNTSGTTNIRVINLGGPGALTVDGIKVVDVGGVSNGTFALVGDYVFEGEPAVVAGAYAYRLYKDGVSTPGDGDWYLRSALTASQPSAPLFQPGVPLYEAYAGSLQVFNGLRTLQQRIGNRSWASSSNGNGGGNGAHLSGVWARIDVARGDFEPKISTSASRYDATTWRLQAGFDALLYESEAGRLIGGAAVHYGRIATSVTSAFGSGSIDTSGIGLTAALTWYDASGFYLDGQAQVTRYQSDLHSATARRILVNDNGGRGYALGIEAGQRIALDDALTLTPQAQLTYSSVQFDRFTDSFAADVSLDRSRSLVGRLGLAVDHRREWRDAQDRAARAHLYAIANLYHDFADGSQVDVAGTSFRSRNDSWRGGIGLGWSASWADDRYSFFGEAQVNTSLESFGRSNILSGTTGFRMRW